MLYEIKIKLTSPWLGQQRTRGQVRRFRRDNGNRLLIDTAQWQWAFQEAADALHLDKVDVSTIHTESGFDAPSLQLYNRRYTYNGKAHTEMFESIREGAVITFDLLVTTPPPGPSDSSSVSPPDNVELKSILAFVGKMLGLSPWGTRFGFGKFTVEQVTSK